MDGIGKDAVEPKSSSSWYSHSLKRSHSSAHFPVGYRKELFRSEDSDLHQHTYLGHASDALPGFIPLLGVSCVSWLMQRLMQSN